MIPKLFSHSIFQQYLEKGEKIMYVAHKHPVMLTKDIIFFLLVGVGIPWYLFASNPKLFWVSVCVAFLGWVRFAYAFVIWYFDCWVITNQGVIDIVWESLFNRKNIRYAFDNFEGITSGINGFWNTIIRCGEVMLIRFVDVNQVKLVNAYRPNYIESKVLKAKAAYQHTSQEGKRSNEDFITKMIADMVTDYADRNKIDLR